MNNKYIKNVNIKKLMLHITSIIQKNNNIPYLRQYST